MIRLLFRIATLAALISIAAFAWWYFKKGPVGTSDGLPFSVVLPVPHFAQRDSQWGADSLAGNSKETLADAGCAVTSAAMVLAYKGVDVDPRRLNAFLTALPGGYTPEGWIEWQKAAQYDPSLTPSLLPHYEDAPSRFYLDWNLFWGNPVIVRLASHNPMRATHFMVVVGKHGRDYLVQDPGMQSASPYPLKDYCAQIQAIRFYKNSTSLSK